MASRLWASSWRLGKVNHPWLTWNCGSLLSRYFYFLDFGYWKYMKVHESTWKYPYWYVGCLVGMMLGGSRTFGVALCLHVEPSHSRSHFRVHLGRVAVHHHPIRNLSIPDKKRCVKPPVSQQLFGWGKSFWPVNQFNHEWLIGQIIILNDFTFNH